VIIHISSIQRTLPLFDATLAGDFPGSSVSMRFHFVLREDKIAQLDIRG